MTKVKIMKINEYAKVPSKANDGDAGLDLFSAEEKEIMPGEIALIHTGLKIELPRNTEAQIRPRSGLALNNAITVLNSPGTIDEGYRGEIGVILINHSNRKFKVETGMKIAQMIIQPIYKYVLKEVQVLSHSDRGDGGYGSSGRF